MNESKHAGGCLCGAVRYRLQNTTTWNVYCHCESCRRHTGAPVAGLITCAPEQVEWIRGERTRYESSPDRYRTFCSECGTSLSWEATVNDRSFVAIHVSTADTPDAFKPTEHVFVDDSIPWFRITDGLKQYAQGKNI